MTLTSLLTDSLPKHSQQVRTARSCRSEASSSTGHQEISPPKNTPQDQYLSNLQRTTPPLIDAALEPTSAVNDKEMPSLDKATLIRTVRLLSEEITVKARDGKSFGQFTFSFKELYAYLEERFEKELELKIDELQIVGGMVFWLLKDTYLSEALTELGIENPKEFLTEALMAEFGAAPSDTDFRFIFPNATKQHLKRQKGMVEDFFVEKLLKRETGLSEDELKRRVHGNAFLKRNTQYDKENCYSTVSVGDPESSRNFDLLFIKSLKRYGLFIKDMQLNISPLIQALKECQWNPDLLIEKIELDAFCPKIAPESPFLKKAWLPLLVDCPALLIRAAAPEEINNSGWPALVSAATKGKFCLQGDLNKILWTTFCKANIRFLLNSRKKKKGPSRPSYQEQIESKVVSQLANALSRFQSPLSQEAVATFQKSLLHTFRSLEGTYLLAAPAKKGSLALRMQAHLNREINTFIDTTFPEEDQSLALNVKQQIQKAVNKAFLEALKRHEESLAKTPAFWLKKTLKNHHRDDPLAAFALTFNACLMLENPEDAATLWETMSPAFLQSGNPLAQHIHSLLENKVPFHEVAALMQAKAFLDLNAAEKDPHFSASLCMPAERPFLKVDLGGSFLCFPFSPEEAFHCLSKTENPYSLAFINDHLCPSSPYIAGNPFPTPINGLMKIGISLLSTNPALGSALIVACSVAAQNERAFDLLIDSIPAFLQYPHLMQSLSCLPLQNRALRVLDTYNELSKMHGDNNKLRWAHALITSDDAALVKKGYDLLAEQMPIAKDLLLVILKDLTRSRPDLALTLIARLGPEDIAPAESINIWLDASSCYMQGRKICQSKELLLLFNTFESHLSKNADVLSSSELLSRLGWLNRGLLENGHIEESIRLLQFLKGKNVPLNQVLSWGSLPEGSTLKANSKELFRKLVSDKDPEHLTLALTLLSDSQFCSNFSLEELADFKSIFKEAVRLADQEGYTKELSKYLKFILGKWEEDNDTFTAYLGITLKHLLRLRRQQPLGQFLNELLDGKLEKILQRLIEQKRGSAAIKILKNASLADTSNRMAYLKSRMDDLSKPPAHAIFQEAVIATASHILQNNPGEQEWLTILAVYEALPAIPLHNLRLILDDAATHPSEAVRSKAFDLITVRLEDVQPASSSAERAELWLASIRGLKKYSDPKIVDLFKKTPTFCRVFSSPDLEDKRNEAFKLSFECLSAVVKAKKLPPQSCEHIISFKEQLIDTVPRDLLQFIDLTIAECLADSGKPALLQEACRIVDLKIREGKIDLRLEEALITVIDAACRQKTIEGNLLEQITSLLKTVREHGSSVNSLPALLSKLGRHSESHLVLEACLILQEVKENCGQKDFKPNWSLKEMSSAASCLLENALKNHFQKASPCLCSLLSDLQWTAAFNIPGLQGHFSTFMKLRAQSFTKETPAEELTEYYQCTLANLSVLMKGGQIEDALIQEAIDVICLLGAKARTFPEDLVSKLLASVAEMRKTAPAPRVRKGKKQPAGKEGSTSVSQNKEAEYETKTNSWKIYFLNKILQQGLKETQLKSAFIDSADQIIQTLLRTKNKDEALFAEFLQKYLFLSFRHEEMELFHSYRKRTKAAVKAALNEGFIDSKTEWLAACALHFEIDMPVSRPPSKDAVQPFEAMAERLAQGSLDDIKECLFMLQEGRTPLLERYPESLEKIYKLVLRKIKKIKHPDAECLKLLDLMQKGILFEHPNKKPANPLIAKGKSPEWQAASRGICSDFIRTLFSLNTPEENSKEHQEMKLHIAQEFLSKALRQNCFEGNYVAYMRALEVLMNETANIKDSELFKRSSAKIYVLMLIPNTQEALSKKEKEQRAASFIYWLKLLAGSPEGTSIGKDQFLRAQQGPPPKIFDGFPKLLKSAEALFPIGEESKKEAKPSAGIAIPGSTKGAIPDSLAPISPADAVLQVTSPLTESSLSLLKSYFDFYRQNGEIGKAIELLTNFLNRDFIIEEGLQQRVDLLFCTWTYIILEHKMGGVKAAFSLWELVERRGVWSIPLSATHAGLLDKLAESVVHDPERFEKFIDLSKKYAPYNICLSYEKMILSYLDMLIQRMGYRDVHLKINGDWTCCLTETNKFSLRLNLSKELLRVGHYPESVEQLGYLLDSELTSTQGAELNAAIFTTLKYLLEGSFTYQEHLEKLRAVFSILMKPYYRDLCSSNPQEAVRFLLAFQDQVDSLGELKDEAASLFKVIIQDQDPAIKAELLFNKLKAALGTKTIDAAELKEILRDLSDDRRAYALLFDLIKRAVKSQKDEVWEGSQKDICICLLYAIKRLHSQPDMGLFILRNAANFLEYFEHADLLSYKLDALTTIFESLEAILEKADDEDEGLALAFFLLSSLEVNFLGYKAKELSSRDNGPPELLNKIMLAHNAASLAIVRLTLINDSDGGLPSALIALRKIKFADVRNYHLKKICMVLTEMLHCCKKSGQEDLIPDIQAVSQEVRSKGSLQVDYFPSILAFLKLDSPLLHKEACRLLVLEIMKQNEDRFLSILRILEGLIERHLDTCYQELGDCLLQMNKTTWGGAEETANLWDAFLSGSPKTEDASEKSFMPLLASLNGIYASPEVSKKVTDRCFSVLIPLFNRDLSLYRLCHQAFCLRLAQHYFFKIEGPRGIGEEEIIDSNSFHFDFNGKLFETMESFINQSRESYLSRESILAADTVVIQYFIKLLRHQKINTREQNADKEKASKETALILGLARHFIAKLLNYPETDSLPEDLDLFMEMFTGCILYPFPKHASAENQRHLRECEALAKMARNKGIFKRRPKDFFTLKLIFSELEYKSSIPKLDATEEKHALYDLLVLLLNDASFSSLDLAINLLQDKKPEILTDNPKLLLGCYRIAARSLENSRYVPEKDEDPYLVTLANHALELHVHPASKSLVPAKTSTASRMKRGDILGLERADAAKRESLTKASTNQLLQPKKSKEWKKYSAKIGKTLFFAVCRYEEAKEIFAVKPDLSATCKFFKEAAEKGLFEGSTSSYLKCLNHFLNHTFVLLEYPKVDFTAYCGQVMSIMSNNDRSLGEEGLKKKMEAIQHWFAKILSSRQSPAYKDLVMALLSEAKKSPMQGSFSGLLDAIEKTLFGNTGAVQDKGGPSSSLVLNADALNGSTLYLPASLLEGIQTSSLAALPLSSFTLPLLEGSNPQSLVFGSFAPSASGDSTTPSFRFTSPQGVAISEERTPTSDPSGSGVPQRSAHRSARRKRKIKK